MALMEQAALRYLARRQRTEANVKEYLRRVGASPTQIRTLVRKFVERGYLNDDSYALGWAGKRLARRPMGRARLEAELWRQGIDRATAMRVVAQVYQEHDERSLAQALLARRPVLLAAGSPSRAASLLRRHGFSEETIEELLGS